MDHHTDFINLAERLRSVYGTYIMDQLPQLPKKTFMRQSSDAFVKKRHYYLQQFLNGIHSIPFLVQSKQYRQFLCLDSFFPSSIPITPFLKFVQSKEQHSIRLSNFNMIMLSHNVFISIAGCHPEIAFCSTEKINSIQSRINALSQSPRASHAAARQRKRKQSQRSKARSSSQMDQSSQYKTVSGRTTPSPLMSNGHSHSSMGAFGSASATSLAGGLTNSPSTLPSPNEWAGCIQVEFVSFAHRE